MSRTSLSARRIATVWADGHHRSPLVIRGFAEQVQDHLDHGADEDYLRAVAAWMSIRQPGGLDLDMAMRMADCPKPHITARSPHVCVCRGGSPRAGGAPAPAMLRQLIRRPQAA